MVWLVAFNPFSSRNLLFFTVCHNLPFVAQSEREHDELQWKVWIPYLRLKIPQKKQMGTVEKDLHCHHFINSKSCQDLKTQTCASTEDGGLFQVGPIFGRGIQTQLSWLHANSCKVRTNTPSLHCIKWHDPDHKRLKLAFKAGLILWIVFIREEQHSTDFSRGVAEIGRKIWRRNHCILIVERALKVGTHYSSWTRIDQHPFTLINWANVTKLHCSTSSWLDDLFSPRCLGFKHLRPTCAGGFSSELQTNIRLFENRCL